MRDAFGPNNPLVRVRRPPLLEFLPVVIDVRRYELRGHNERSENLRRARNDVVERPRVDDEQVLRSARCGRGLEPEAGVAFLREEVPALQFDSHERFVSGLGAIPEENVGERLGFTNS